LRLREPDLAHVYIDSRDGITREFDKIEGLTSPWRLAKISDATGNHVDISYPNALRWVITDVARTITVQFAIPPAPGSTYLNTVLQSVTMPSPAGNGATVTYNFATQLQSMPIPIGVSNAGIISVPVLTAVTPPAGNPYTFAYEGSDNSFSGCLLHMTVPTGGTYAWGYIEGDVRYGALSPSVETPVEVSARTVTDPATDPGAATPSVWHYNYTAGYQFDCFGKADQRERISTIQRPDLTREVHHYNAFKSDQCWQDPLGETWSSNDYGLPFTQTTVECAMPWYVNHGDTTCAHSVARADPTGGSLKQYLSSEVFDSSGNLLQAHYVTYDGDPPQTAGDPRPNARVSAEVVYAEDTTTPIADVAWMVCPPLYNCSNAAQPKLPNLFTATHRYNYRQFGNYATTVTSGKGADGTVPSRTTFQNFPSFTNPTTLPTFALDVPSGSCVADGDVHSSISDAVQPTLTACAGMGNPFITLFDYDQTHNLLNGKRVLKGVNGAATRATDDLLVHYLYENLTDAQNLGSNGNLTTEAYEGGDGGTLGTGTDFPYSSSSNYVIIRHDHTYAGALFTLKSHYDGHTFAMSDFTVDRPSGLISSSRDASGLQTNYTYDDLGRLHVVTPPGGATTTYTYAESAIPVHIDATTTAGGSTLKRASYEYDGLGRLWHEKSFVNSGWSTRTTRYDSLSRVIAVSPLQASVSECPGNTNCSVTAYDPLGRVASSTNPDGFVTTFAYDGGARTKRTQTLDNNSPPTQAITTENYDGLGRLHSVVDPVNTTGTYAYDAADHLTQAIVDDGLGHTQPRSFVYDHRGFLASETHPESGQVSYTYDQRGHMLTKTLAPTGTFDLTFAYDSAERLLNVFTRPAANQGFSQIMKKFQYYSDTDGTYAGSADHSSGKLQTATRHNYQAAGDVEVSETYHYIDPAGRLTHRTTAICLASIPTQPDNCTLKQSLTQSTAYNELGLPATTILPACDVPTSCQTPAWSSITRNYTEGRLTSVQNSAQNFATMTYSENEMLNTIAHVNGVTDTIEKDDRNQLRPKSIMVVSCNGPAWVNEPASQNEPANTQFTLTALASGTAPLTYTWKIGSTVVGTTQNLTTTLAATTTFTLTVTGCGAPLTDTFTITVVDCSSPVITTQPSNRLLVPYNQTLNPPLTVVASGGSLSYQWFELENPTALGTSASFAPVVQHSGIYYAKVTNTCGSSTSSTTSNLVAVTFVLPPPANLVATAGSGGSGNITVSWTLLSGYPVDHYEVWRTLSGPAGWGSQPIATLSNVTNSWVDTTVALGQAAAYKVRAVEVRPYNSAYLANPSNDSNADVATRFAFSAIPPWVSFAPLDQARLAINAVQIAAGQSPQTWGPLVTPAPAPQVGGLVLAAHINVLRSALRNALSQFSITLPPFTDDGPQGLTAGTPIKLVHVTELQGRTQ